MRRRRGLQAGELPRLTINAEAILKTCENKQSEYVTYDSLIKGTGYVCSGGEVLILSEEGFLRVKEGDLEAMIEELKFLAECQSIRRRA